jgi:peptide deformylase
MPKLLTPIRLKNDSIFSKKTRVVKKMTTEINELIDDMIFTMKEIGAAGLAANQVGSLHRIILVGIGGTYDPTITPLVFINPEVAAVSEEQFMMGEGCFSIPGIPHSFPRPLYVRGRGLDRNMRKFTYQFYMFPARAFLHELDHLDNIFFDQRWLEYLSGVSVRNPITLFDYKKEK